MSESLIHLPKNPAWGEEYWIKGVKYQAIRGHPNKWSQVQPGISEVDKCAVANKFTGSPGIVNKNLSSNTITQSAKPKPIELTPWQKEQQQFKSWREKAVAGNKDATRQLSNWGQPLTKSQTTSNDSFKESAEWARLIHLVEFLKTK